MNARLQFKTWRLGAVLLLSLAALGAASPEVPVNSQFAITAISVRGTNVVLSAAIPAGLTQVRLEMRPTLDAPWKTIELPSPPAGGGEVTFAIPKPGEMQFFRLRAAAQTESVASAETLSEELRYVTIAPLGPVASARGGAKGAPVEPEAVFHFKGMVDGSDHIVITREGALWQHAHWDWPQGGVTVNSTQWDPCQKNYLTTAGTAKFLPAPFSLETADLEIIKGRDVVALERADEALIVHIDDTPPGSDEYEFKIHFHHTKPKPAKASPSAGATLRIAAQIDGSDCLRITGREATWKHTQWDWPAKVTLNDVAWSVQQTNVLRNDGPNQFLPVGVDFSTARIISRKGRDLATMWAEKDGLSVWFADNPNGDDSYEIVISFQGAQ